MKKHIVLFLLLISLLLVGCGNGSHNGATQDETSKYSVSTTVSTIESTFVAEESTTIAPTTVPSSTVHTHQWEDVTSTIHHDPVIDTVWVVDKPAETLQCTRTTLTCSYPDCQKYDVKYVLDTGENSAYYNSMLQNSEIHMQDHKNKIDAKNAEALRKKELYGLPSVALVSYPHYDEYVEYYEKVIPEEGHYSTKTTKEGYDEIVVTGQRCITCGELKQSTTN